jgi:hypothetical protein
VATSEVLEDLLQRRVQNVNRFFERVFSCCLEIFQPQICVQKESSYFLFIRESFVRNFKSNQLYNGFDQEINKVESSSGSRLQVSFFFSYYETKSTMESIFSTFSSHISLWIWASRSSLRFRWNATLQKSNKSDDFVPIRSQYLPESNGCEVWTH